LLEYFAIFTASASKLTRAITRIYLIERTCMELELRLFSELEAGKQRGRENDYDWAARLEKKRG
jgi:hypothetical protein